MKHALTSNIEPFEHLPDFVFLINPQTEKVDYVDKKVHKILGYTRNEFLKLKLHDIFVSETGEGNEKGISDIFLNGDRNCFEIFQKRKDGKLINAQITIEHLKLHDHSYILCISRANEKNKGTDELLLDEKNKLQAIIEALDCGLSIIDKNYIIVYQNKLVNDLFGGVGNKCYRVYEGNKKICDGCPVEKAFGDGISHSSVRTVTMPSGETGYWENTANPIRNAKGDIVACLEIAKNITEIEKMVKKLHQTQKDWDDIFDTVPDMITIHDKDFNIIRANKAAQRMLDLPSLGDVAEVKCFQYYHGTEAPLKGCPSCNCFTTKKPAVFEVFEPYLNMFIEIRAIPRFDNNNQLIGLIHVVRDITKRKETEASLRRLNDDLDAKTNSLIETNQALKVLLKHREKDKEDMEHNIILNLNNLVLPYIKKLKTKRLDSQSIDYLNILESNMMDIVSQFSLKLSSPSICFTPKEIQVANLIKEGKQSKDISELLQVTFETVNCHRQNIRKKLGIQNNKTNLRTYLLSFPD